MTEAEIGKIKAVVPERLESPKFWVEHIPFAFYLLTKLKPSVIVELGVHSGNSFFAFCQAVKENSLSTKCYGIDTWLGDKHSGHYYADVYESVVKHQQENYPHSGILIKKTFNEALNNFKDGSIDLLHIDGLHTYEGVRDDFQNWLPKLSTKGVVLFHDTQIKMKDFGVWKFWSEVSKKYPSFEFDHGCGLGVLVIGKDVLPEIQSFINEVNRSENYQLFFKNEGRRIYELYKKERIKSGMKSIFLIHRIIAKRFKRTSA